MRFSQLCFGIVCLLAQTRYGVECVQDFGSLDEFQSLLQDQGNKLVVVFFTATWCGPCKMIAPEFTTLSSAPENVNVVFGKVDVDDASEISIEYDISCMPTFVFLKQMKEIDRLTGANLESLKDKISEHR